MRLDVIDDGGGGLGEHGGALCCRKDDGNGVANDVLRWWAGPTKKFGFRSIDGIGSSSSAELPRS